LSLSKTSVAAGNLHQLSMQKNDINNKLASALIVFLPHSPTSRSGITVWKGSNLS